MAEKKTIIETNAHPVRGSGSDGEHDVEAGLRLAMELQDAGVVLTSEVLAALTMRFEYEAQALRYCARIQVPAEFGEPDVLWQTVVAVAARRQSAREELLGTVTLEQLHEIRSKISERIDEVEKRLHIAPEPDDTSAPAAPEIDVVTAKTARVRAASTSPHDVIAAANLASRTLALGRNDAGLAPTDAPIALAVAIDSPRVFVTASYLKTF